MNATVLIVPFVLAVVTERELTATVGDVSAAYDHRGRLEHVDVRLGYETSHETNVGKRRVTYGSPEFRFSVDGDGVARLARLHSRQTDRSPDDVEGARVADVRAIPAAIEVVEGIGDVERVEPVARTVTERIEEIETVEFDAE